MRNYCLLYVSHSSLLLLVFFSLAQDSCFVTRLSPFGGALRESSFAILCERVAIRLDNLNARVILLQIIFPYESISLDNHLEENELN